MERSALKAVINLVEVRSKSINLRIFLSCLNMFEHRVLEESMA